MDAIVTMIFVMFCIMISYFYMGGILTPFSVLTFVTGVAVLLVSGADFYFISQSHSTVLLLIFISLFMFFIGFLISKPIKGQRNIGDQLFYVPSMKVIIILFSLSFLGFLFFIWEINKQLGLQEVLINPNILNLAIASKTISFSMWSQYLIKISLINSVFILLKIMQNHHSKLLLVSLYLLQILFTLSVRRSTLILVIVLNMVVALNYYIYFQNKKSVSWKLIFAGTASLIVVYSIFSYFQSALNKMFTYSGHLFGIPLSDASLTFITYLSGNIVSTGHYINMQYDNAFPTFGSTFRLLLNSLSELDLIDYSDSFLALPFVEIPMGYNTALAQFYIFGDAGYLGLVLIYLLLGLVSGYFYYGMLYLKTSSTLIINSSISTFLLFSIREYGLIFIDYWLLMISLSVLYFFERRFRRRSI